MNARSKRTPGRSRVLALLQRSPVVADAIPWQLRVLDVSLALLALPLVLVAGSVLALAVLVDSPGPIFYRSIRIGRGGRPFAMLKLRTMRHDVDGPSLSVKDDHRFTPLGRSLAVSRLDELPQLWNVLKGDMRLVGPRPELQDFVEAFPTEYERILSVPPGLTGPAQLRFATEGRLLAEAEDRIVYYRERLLPLKVSIDLAYAQRHSVLRDLGIIALTVIIPIQQAAMGLRPAPDSFGSPGRQAALMGLVAVSLALGSLTLFGLMVAEAASP